MGAHPGFQDNAASHYSLVNATIAIVDERIVAVGEDLQPPQGVQLIDLQGAYVYPG